MAAVRHFGFVMRVLGPPTKRILWSLSVQNLVGIDAVVSIICMFFDFASFGLKVPIHAAKIGVFGDSNETRAPIANPPSSTQLGAPPTIRPSYIRVCAVVWECGEEQTDRHTYRRA